MARRGMERQTESFAEHEEAQQDGPESPDSRYKEEAEPDGRGFQLGDGEGPQGHEQGAVPDVADHEPEKEGSGDEKEQRGIQLAVARRRIEMDKELEGFRRFGVSEQDRGVRFLMYGLRAVGFNVHALSFQRGSNGVESLFGHPAVDYERVIAHCEPQGAFRLVDPALDQLLRGDHESGVFLAQCLQATAKLFEPCPPLLAVREGGIEQPFGIRFARWDVDLDEAELAEHV